MASVTQVGTMAAVVGVGEQVVAECCEQARFRGPVVIALYNGPGRFVVSGATPAVEECGRRLQAAGAKLVRLATSNAFHSPLMEEVADEWADVVGEVPFKVPSLPIVLNTTGGLARDVDDIRRAVTDQLTMPVRWHEAITILVGAGATAFIECGDSKTLSTFSRAIAPLIPTATMADPRSVRRLASSPAAASQLRAGDRPPLG
jgi:[acyl-carrier-protein] S-malonyltransferase